MAIVQVWKVAIVGLGPKGEAIVNVFHFGPSTTDLTCTAESVALAADTVLPPLMQGLTTTDWSYYQTQVLCVAGTNIGKSSNNSISAPLFGTLAAPSAPLDICAIMKVKALGIGKHSRGRKFFSPIPQTFVDVDGQFNDLGPYGPAVSAIGSQTLTVGGVTMVPCLWDVTHNQALAVNSVGLARMTGTQRRRRLRLPN